MNRGFSCRLFAPACLLLIPFSAYIRYNDYPLGQPEIIISASVIIVFGFFLGFLISRFSEPLPCVVYTLIVALSIDIYLGSQWLVFVTQFSGGKPFAVVCVFLLFVLVVFRVLHKHLPFILVVSSLTTVFCTLVFRVNTIGVGEWRKPIAQVKTNLPPVVHIILDEQIGINGFPSEVAQANETAQTLKNFYTHNNFTLYGSAFSYFADTRRSLSRLVNGSANPDPDVFTHADNIPFSVRDNAWFESLSKSGYHIRVYQSDYMDFCHAEKASVSSCLTYASNSIHALANADVNIFYKLRVIVHRFVAKSIFYRLTMKLIRVASGDKLISTDELWLGGISTFPVFERIAEDMAYQAQGVAFFAHLLLPHSSYVFDRDCRARSDPTTWYRNFDPLEIQSGNSRLLRQKKYQYYFDQVLCTHKEVDNLLAQMKRLGVYEEALIIIHGDHGSRIAVNMAHVKNKHKLTSVDLRDSFSTLMAVHSPTISAGYVSEPNSIQTLFSDIILKRPLQKHSDQLFLSPVKAGADELFPGVPVSKLFE